MLLQRSMLRGGGPMTTLGRGRASALEWRVLAWVVVAAWGWGATLTSGRLAIQMSELRCLLIAQSSWDVFGTYF